MNHRQSLLGFLECDGGILDLRQDLRVDVAALVLVQEVAQLLELCGHHFGRVLWLAVVKFVMARSSGRGSPAGVLLSIVRGFFRLPGCIYTCSQDLPSVRSEGAPLTPP